MNSSPHLAATRAAATLCLCSLLIAPCAGSALARGNPAEMGSSAPALLPPDPPRNNDPVPGEIVPFHFVAEDGAVDADGSGAWWDWSDITLMPSDGFAPMLGRQELNTLPEREMFSTLDVLLLFGFDTDR